MVAFVSHCGANSMYESLMAAVPIVCCPGFADQPANAARLESAGCGVVSKGGSSGVAAALSALLGDLGAFQRQAAALRVILLSQGGPRRGADLVETAGQVGYEHMRPRATRSSWCSWLIIAGIAAAAGSTSFRRRMINLQSVCFL